MTLFELLDDDFLNQFEQQDAKIIQQCYSDYKTQYSLLLQAYKSMVPQIKSLLSFSFTYVEINEEGLFCTIKISNEACALLENGKPTLLSAKLTHKLKKRITTLHSLYPN